jgi:aspartate carbamoyltransferase catalytic subunit
LLESAPMSKGFQSFFCTSQCTKQEIESVFQRASFFKNSWQYSKSFETRELEDQTLVLAFLEPSTRTRLSFEMAAHRLKMKVLSFADLHQTSLKKGESYFETFKNVARLNPEIIVLRWQSPVSLWDELKTLNVPLINAGVGTEGHPTQALLDAFTMQSQFGHLKNRRILFYGDIKHSRVFASNQRLLKVLGAELAICCPDEFLPEESILSQVKRVPTLKEGLDWCDVVMGLRVQVERFSGDFDKKQVVSKYQLNAENLSALKSTAMIMHPGPFNLGIELTKDVLEDDRVRIYDQVENGVYVRAALIEKCLLNRS